MTPKSKENVEILVKSIIEKDTGMIRVKDSALIPYYLSNSKYMIEIEPEDKSELRFLKFQGQEIEDDFNGIKRCHLELAKDLSANYIFASTYYETHGILVSVVNPFKIISDKETDFLLKNFYKDIPENVLKAAEELEIVLYDKIYSYYTQGKIDKISAFLRMDSETWNNYSPFLNFVFNLPYEDQNIESNKTILNVYSSRCDLTGIMAKEYSEGKHFQEYFNRLYYNQEKENVVSKIKLLERKPDHDVFLLKKGYVLGENSAIELYKTDAKAFIDYFEKLNQESKKTLVEKIYEEPAVNQEVAAWLEKNYTPLLREVGFSGGKQNGSNK